MKKSTFLVVVTVLTSLSVWAQTPFIVHDSINANNITASAQVHGDMWWTSPNSFKGCRYKDQKRRVITFIGALWLSAYDDAGQLHVAAQTYRQSGNDYWPGPLDDAGNTNYATSEQWAHIWKVTRAEVNTYKATGFHTPANIPESILTWPGKGNAFAKGNNGAPLTIDRNMAPFYDHDGDGIYEPMKGDYPEFKGEQALWWLINDNGPAHTETNGRPLKVEVQCMAYAYKRNTLIDDVVYYDYKITSRNTEPLHNMRFAIWDHINWGNYLEECIGFDSSHRMGIAYNRFSSLGGIAGNPSGSFYEPGVTKGITLIKVPGDIDGNYVQAGSFIFFNDDPSIYGAPKVDTEYNNYLRSKFRYGRHISYDPASPFSNTGVEKQYSFPDDPSGTGNWHLCYPGSPITFENYVLSTSDFELPAGSTRGVLMALVVDSVEGYCPVMSYEGIKRVADTAWGVYNNPPPELGTASTEKVANPIKLYPNPANETISLDWNCGIAGNYSVIIADAMGVTAAKYSCKTGKICNLDISALANGLWFVRCASEDGITARAVFTKL
jgi:hypothetical protein